MKCVKQEKAVKRVCIVCVLCLLSYAVPLAANVISQCCDLKSPPNGCSGCIGGADMYLLAGQNILHKCVSSTQEGWTCTESRRECAVIPGPSNIYSDALCTQIVGNVQGPTIVEFDQCGTCDCD